MSDSMMEHTSAAPRGVAPQYLLMADIFHMLLAAVVLGMFLFSGTEVPFIFQVAITSLIMVVLLRGGVWLVLGAMQVSMFFYETRVSDNAFGPGTLAQTLCCLAVIAYAAGFPTLRRLLREWLGLGLAILLSDYQHPRTDSALARLEAHQEQLANYVLFRRQAINLAVRMMRLLVIVLIASVAFVRLPFTVPGVRSWWAGSMQMDNTLWPGPTAFTLAIVCLLIVAIGSWKRLNASQAALYVRSFYVRSHFKELRSILVRGGQLSKPLQRPLSRVGPSDGIRRVTKAEN